ncbi:diguanylate cyclase [Candidatus Woesearchaeota archaeon]|nr:diguanylate cyclase [Candidatus Woesearchaeota archaeon]
MVSKEELENLTEIELSLLKNFQDQIDTLHRHERYVYRLVRRLKRLRKCMEKGDEKEANSSFDEIKGIIQVLKSEILEKFKILKSEAAAEEIQQTMNYERKRGQAFIDIKKFLINTYNKLAKEEELLQKKRTLAERKIRRALIKLREGIEETGRRGLKLNEQVFLLIEKLHEFKETLYNLIAYEYQLLKNIESNFSSNLKTDEKIEKFEDIDGRLRQAIVNIKKHLRTEKEEVYKPLMNLIGKEISGAEAFFRLKEKKKGEIITLDDIKSDIYTMIDSMEILEYLSALEANRDIIEEKAWPHIYNYKIKAQEIVEKIKKESIVDPLTGLFTKKLMWAQLDNLTFGSAGKPDSFSVIIMDIDNFKSVNDVLGHLVGDSVLAKVARLIRANVRNSDIVCRYGGEEFVIIMPRTKAAEAILKAEETRKAVEKYEFGLRDRRRVTICGGVASYDGKVSKEELIAFADEKLYKAKRTPGKNTIVS